MWKEEKFLTRVLLIDDDLQQLWLREAVLCAAGFQVVRAASCEAALALLRSLPAAKQPEAIVADHLVAGASGIDFVLELRSVNPHAPLLVLNRLNRPEPEYDGLDVTFLSGPCTPDKLIRQLGEVFAGQPA